MIYHDNGWGPFVDNVDVFEVPGDHDSMVLEPNVRVLAARLRACIEDAESPGALASTPPPLPLETTPPRAANDTACSTPAGVVA